MWENTGFVERSGDVYAGTTGVQAGIAGVAQAGIVPVAFISRSPNAYAKLAVVRTRRWNVAVQVGGYRLLSGATRSFYSPAYSTRLDNPDFGITLVPVAVSASTEIGSWLELHQTITMLGVITSGPLRNGVTTGYSAVAEVNPHGRHALSFHFAEVGFWSQDLALAGASYRYRNGFLEMRLGYFYRFTRTGMQAAPLAALAVLL